MQTVLNRKGVPFYYGGKPESVMDESSNRIANGSYYIDVIDSNIYVMNNKWVEITDSSELSSLVPSSDDIKQTETSVISDYHLFQTSISTYYTIDIEEVVSIYLPQTFGNAGSLVAIEDTLSYGINIMDEPTRRFNILNFLGGIPNFESKHYFFCDGVEWHLAKSFVPSINELVIPITRAELLNKIDNNQLINGSGYLITDFRTCYDQPNYDSIGNPLVDSDTYKVCDIEPILVSAISTNSISQDAYQANYPKDKIKFDLHWNTTEITENVAYGRITERIDEYNNRTDYDHRNIKFKRYKSYFHDKKQPNVGTITVDGFTVVGTNTTFTTSLTVNRWIAIDELVEPTFENQDGSIKTTIFKIVDIIDDNNMLLEGINGINITDSLYYSAEPSSSSYTTWEYLEIKQNNLLDDEPIEFKTFQYDYELIQNGRAISINNFIGNHSFFYLNNEIGVSYFMLSNNVFGRFTVSNEFGERCFNNAFAESSVNNIIGNYSHNNNIKFAFTNNIIGNNFYKNKIRYFFRDNIITTNFKNNITLGTFQSNIIADGFNFNLIYSLFYLNKINTNVTNNIIFSDFYFNNIDENFNNNIIGYLNSGNYFQYNTTGKGFNSNTIYSVFENNSIGNFCHDNTILVQFVGNNIGAEFVYNNIGDETHTGFLFRTNNIGDNFKGNLILNEFQYNDINYGFVSNEVYGYSFRNKIGNDAINNNIYNFFQNNIINNSFQNNIIGNIGDIVMGYSFASNTIGHDFQSNTISNSFYNNNINFGFSNNIIVGVFNSNEIKTALYNVDFTSSTLVYNYYNCTIIKASDTNNYITYFDGTTNVYAAITA